MTFQITFFGATEQLTGSLSLIGAGSHPVLLECGLIQGSRKDEARKGAGDRQHEGQMKH